MLITQDSFGNTFAGNFVSGHLWDPNTLLTVLRTALGSNDRANINFQDKNNFRIDWRPNIPEETLTGEIAIPPRRDIGNFMVYSNTITANARMGFSHAVVLRNWQDNQGTVILDTDVYNTTGINVASPGFLAGEYWAVATKSSLSYFVYSTPLNYLFISIGVLKNSNLTYPMNRYGFYAARSNNELNVNGNSLVALTNAINSNLGVVDIKTNGSIANYAHTKLSDGTATNSEVELYLRRSSNNVPLGYVPNVFKWKVNGSELAPAIGDIVRLNMANATGDYAGQGNIFCKVVGSLGNTSNTDVTGDYLLMRIAG